MAWHILQVVRFSGIKYKRKFEISNNGYETFGNKLVDWFVGPLKTLLQRKKFNMVGDSEGSGRVYHAWIHDPPTRASSGKSTLLEILAGRANGNKNSILEGVVMYNNKQASDIRLSRFIAYISNQLNITISRIKQSSAIMSLTQLSQEVFDLFDRIILLSDGHVLFQGPRQDAIPYFATLEYIKPSYVKSCEFLEDIAAGDSSQYIVPGSTPLKLEELLECYKASYHS
ncbi:Brefeldin A resistance protein [Fagus crenata]